MVFENQHPGRRAQNMAALLALVIMLGILLPIPIGANFADWINGQNAPSNIDTKFTEGPFVWTDNDLYAGTGYKPYFSWWNGSNDNSLNKHNVTMTSGVLDADLASIDDNNAYNNTDTTDYGPDWDNGIPVWLVTFNYTAKQAYTDNVVKIGIKMTSDYSVDTVSGGKKMLSCPDGTHSDEYEAVTVELSAGGVTFYTATLPSTGDGLIEQNATISTNDLRLAIMGGGDEAFFTLKVTGHDIRPIDMGGSAFYTYNVAKLFGRDDGLYITSMVSIIAAALGIFLVQPRWNLPLGTRGQGGRRRF